MGHTPRPKAAFGGEPVNAFFSLMVPFQHTGMNDTLLKTFLSSQLHFILTSVNYQEKIHRGIAFQYPGFVSNGTHFMMRLLTQMINLHGYSVQFSCSLPAQSKTSHSRGSF